MDRTRERFTYIPRDIQSLVAPLVINDANVTLSSTLINLQQPGLTALGTSTYVQAELKERSRVLYQQKFATNLYFAGNHRTTTGEIDWDETYYQANVLMNGTITPQQYNVGNHNRYRFIRNYNNMALGRDEETVDYLAALKARFDKLLPLLEAHFITVLNNSSSKQWSEQLDDAARLFDYCSILVRRAVIDQWLRPFFTAIDGTWLPAYSINIIWEEYHNYFPVSVIEEGDNITNLPLSMFDHLEEYFTLEQLQQISRYEQSRVCAAIKHDDVIIFENAVRRSNAGMSEEVIREDIIKYNHYNVLTRYDSINLLLHYWTTDEADKSKRLLPLIDYSLVVDSPRIRNYLGPSRIIPAKVSNITFRPPNNLLANDIIPFIKQSDFSNIAQLLMTWGTCGNLYTGMMLHHIKFKKPLSYNLYEAIIFDFLKSADSWKILAIKALLPITAITKQCYHKTFAELFEPNNLQHLYSYTFSGLYLIYFRYYFLLKRVSEIPYRCYAYPFIPFTTINDEQCDFTPLPFARLLLFDNDYVQNLIVESRRLAGSTNSFLSQAEMNDFYEEVEPHRLLDTSGWQMRSGFKLFYLPAHTAGSITTNQDFSIIDFPVSDLDWLNTQLNYIKAMDVE